MLDQLVIPAVSGKPLAATPWVVRKWSIHTQIGFVVNG